MRYPVDIFKLLYFHIFVSFSFHDKDLLLLQQLIAAPVHKTKVNLHSPLIVLHVLLVPSLRYLSFSS